MDSKTPKPAVTPVDPAPRKLSYGSARPSRWSGLGSATRRWARDTFSRQQLFAGLKSLAWVAPLTVLIWVYAEREQLARVSSVPVRVEVRSGDPSKVVSLLDPVTGQFAPDQRVTFDLSGPRARVEAVRELLNSGGPGGIAVQVNAPDLPPGRQTVDALLASNDPRFVENGVTLANPTPARLDVLVDKTEVREVPVRVPPDVTNLTDAPVFTPATVKVSGPASVLNGLEAAYADLAALPQIKVPGSHPEVKSIRVTVPNPDPRVTVSPPTVAGSLSVRREDVTYTIRSMGIYVSAPFSLLEDFGVEPAERTLANVTVVGPEDQIALLRNENNPPTYKAVIEVTREDARGDRRMAPVRYEGLPPGVRVSPDDEKRKVEFRLVDRKSIE